MAKQPEETDTGSYWETVTVLTEPYFAKPPGMERPHCHATLSLKEAIIVLNGGALESMPVGLENGGFPRRARVRIPDGTVGFVNAGEQSYAENV
jgi:hypothetical protein